MKSSNASLVAMVCLYGRSGHKCGFIAVLPDNTSVGDGEQGFGSLTDALFAASRALWDRNVKLGQMKVCMHSPLYAGGVEAITSVSSPGYVGGLDWKESRPITISAAEIMAAAE